MTVSTGGNAPMSRYAKPATGIGRGGYNPPVYGGDYYNYSDKGREEGKKKNVILFNSFVCF